MPVGDKIGQGLPRAVAKGLAGFGGIDARHADAMLSFAGIEHRDGVTIGHAHDLARKLSG